MTKSIKPIVVIDLDGTLAAYDGWKGVHRIGTMIKDANWFVKEMKEFARPMIYTTRTNAEANPDIGQPYLIKIIKNWLRDNGIDAEVYSRPGKPLAACFVDDRGVNCAPQHGSDFGTVLKQVEELVRRID